MTRARIRLDHWNHSNVLCRRTLNDRVCDEIQSIRTFFLPLLSVSIHRPHSRARTVYFAPLPNAWLVCVCGLIRNQWAELRRKKKVLLFLNTLKVAWWFILFLSSALRFIDCITISILFFFSRTLSKNARPRAFCYETEIKSLKIVSTFFWNNATYNYIH